MRIPSWAVTAAATLAAIPFGWGLGVVVAYLVAGPNIGQLPIMTVPIAILASIVFALLPVLKPWTRLAIMLVGSTLFFLFAPLLL